MKKWVHKLEIVENDDEFFANLDINNQHTMLKTFVLNMLKANGFEARLKLEQYVEDYSDVDDYMSTADVE